MNDAAWRSIADFLSLQYLRQEMSRRARESAPQSLFSGGSVVHVRTDSPVKETPHASSDPNHHRQ